MPPSLIARAAIYPLFNKFTALWQPVWSEITLKRCDKEQVLATHGAAAGTIWLVLSGWVMLVRHTPDGREVITGLCSAGDILGEAGLFPHANYPYTVQILEQDTEVICIPAPLMRRLVQQDAAFSQYLMQELGKRIASTQLQLEQMSSLSAAQRLGCFLLRLCQHQEGKRLEVKILVGKHIIASYLGMKPETLSRSFQQLAQVGVRIKGMQASVEDVTRLRDFVCEHCGESGMCETEEGLIGTGDAMMR